MGGKGCLLGGLSWRLLSVPTRSHCLPDPPVLDKIATETWLPSPIDSRGKAAAQGWLVGWVLNGGIQACLGGWIGEGI